MNITAHQSQIRTLKPGDPKFMLKDTFTVCQRASIEISKDCPASYKQIIAQAYENGWIKPVAHVTERELIFMGLTK
jgi:hypothetical protein